MSGAMASRGSSTTEMPPARLIELRPEAPSLPPPLNTTPMARPP